jgi:hypothetical protein
MTLLPDPRRRPNSDPGAAGLVWSIILIVVIFLVATLVVKALP